MKRVVFLAVVLTACGATAQEGAGSGGGPGSSSPAPEAANAPQAGAPPRPAATAEQIPLDTEERRTLYAAGLALSRQLVVLRLTEAEMAYVHAGVHDGAMGRPARVDLDLYGVKLQNLLKTRLAARAAVNKEAGKRFLATIDPLPGVQVTASGLRIQTVRVGNGPSPTASSRVKVHYAGRLIDNTEFESSFASGAPAEFALGEMIACWKEGLQLMKAGGFAKLYCPAEIAYGDRDQAGIPPGSTLIFDVDLLEVLE